MEAQLNGKLHAQRPHLSPVGTGACCLLTLRAASRSAPLSSITRTTSLWPIWDAIHSGAVPSCGGKEVQSVTGVLLIHPRTSGTPDLRVQKPWRRYPLQPICTSKGNVEKRRPNEHRTTGQCSAGMTLATVHVHTSVLHK